MAKQALARAIALTYVDYAQAQAEARLADEAAAAYAETAEVIRSRYQAGLTDELAAVNADTVRARAEGEAVAARDALVLAQYRLAAMVGEGPDFGLGLAPAALVTPVTAPDGVGIDIVAQRPDIAAARARVEAQLHQVRAAERDFYPNVSISARPVHPCRRDPLGDPGAAPAAFSGGQAERAAQRRAGRSRRGGRGL
jgi:outer membrane protein TolC